MSDDKICDACHQAIPDRACPDGGKCHHNCGSGGCFRVLLCGPLTGVYANDEWPALLVDREREAEGRVQQRIGTAAPAASVGERETERVCAAVRDWAYRHGFVTNASPFTEDEEENENQEAIIADLIAALRSSAGASDATGDDEAR